jgi:hypothetical protein
LQTAKSWRLTPREWRLCSRDDQALMLAYEMFTNTREAYRMEWMEKKSKGESTRNKPSAAEQFEAMRSGMGMK